MEIAGKPDNLISAVTHRFSESLAWLKLAVGCVRRLGNCGKTRQFNFRRNAPIFGKSSLGKVSGRVR
ncbi:hypothetical protein CKA32_001657 [Geitlerinema sp. FC II]|nr:hypothetical protein CKA32_001657 [Geitlerinema sp. FC II]